MIPTSATTDERRGPGLGLSLLICAAILASAAVIRLVLFADRVVPFADGLWLLVFLWLRSRRLLWATAGALLAMAAVKVLWLAPPTVRDEALDWVANSMLVLNIAVTAGVVHIWLNAHEGLVEKHTALQQANAALEAANEELAAREEELARQNEELQAQTEELEQQAEELKNQTEELEQQQAELQESNAELMRRDRAQQVLLEAGRWLVGETAASEAMSQVCRAVLEILGPEAAAAAVVEKREDELAVRAHWGFGAQGMLKHNWAYEHSLASLAMERGRTAYLKDISLRPDLEIPQPVDGRPFRSLIASPLRVEGRIVGAVEVLSYEPRDWTEGDFRVIEWLASQSAIVMEMIGHHQELERRREEAEQESVRKTRFLAAVSHDVRTPTNAINLMAELIARSAATPAATGELPALAADLQSNARALVELVSDVLDLARFDSGRMEIQEGAFSLCEMVESEIRQLRPLAQAKGLELAVPAGPRRLWLRSDRMKLARVVGNLVGNAIKFTERGSVRVECCGRAGGGAELRIIDTGVGIPPEHQSRIFDEFFQLRNPERDRSKGTGLGLAICKRLVDALGLSLTLESQVGQGSAFAIGIPAERIVEAPAVVSAGDAPAAEPADSPLAGLKVLLVEDHDSTRRATARLLAAEGAVVMQAENGRAAIHMLSHEAPHVMLLDLMLPDIDGSEVLRFVQEHGGLRAMRVLALSGDVTARRLEQVRRLGAEALVPKPIDIEQVVRLLQRRAAVEPAPVANPLT